MSKEEAVRDGVVVPTTVDDYCVKSKDTSNISTNNNFEYEDDDDDEDEESLDSFADE